MDQESQFEALIHFSGRSSSIRNSPRPMDGGALLLAAQGERLGRATAPMRSSKPRGWRDVRQTWAEMMRLHYVQRASPLPMSSATSMMQRH